MSALVAHSPKRSDEAPAATEVCITVDTEFSIGGAFADPQRYRPLSTELVECRIGGRSEGLGFILQTLKEFGVAATFFVEVLQGCYFGDVPMRRIVEQLAAANQDIQLHLHPCWLHFAADARGLPQPADDFCAARSQDELAQMIEYGCAAFARWGVPEPIALRTGGFSCGRVVHEAMRRCGLRVGSNIALAAYRPADPKLHLFSGSEVFDGVLEVPALTYATPHLSFASRLRTMAITATSWPEMETLLWQARQAEISPVVVLTHPFEFVKRTDFRYRDMRRNRINQGRLRRLLDFCRRHPDEFAVTTFGRSSAGWRAAGSRPGALLRVPTHLAFGRMAQNLVNTQVWRY